MNEDMTVVIEWAKRLLSICPALPDWKKEKELEKVGNPESTLRANGTSFPSMRQAALPLES
jgi:hypothetical protein